MTKKINENFIEQLKTSGFDKKKFQLTIENLKRSDQTIRFYVEKNKNENSLFNYKKKELIYINPGAAGKHGFHKKQTLIKFELAKGKAQNLIVIELADKTTSDT